MFSPVLYALTHIDTKLTVARQNALWSLVSNGSCIDLTNDLLASPPLSFSAYARVEPRHSVTTRRRQRVSPSAIHCPSGVNIYFFDIMFFCIGL